MHKVLFGNAKGGFFWCQNLPRTKEYFTFLAPELGTYPSIQPFQEISSRVCILLLKGELKKLYISSAGRDDLDKWK